MKETENIVTSTEVEHVVLNSGKLDNSVDAVESSKEAPADENDTNDNNETDESDAFESKLRIGFSNDRKSMISAGLTSLSCNCDMLSSVYRKTSMKVLCIGHGGGSLPLFLACKIPGTSC
uniref:Uncharacterized protein n=1 Tax=Helianthus annuus TaxID=4232 RepID=A0A251TAN8_HELAN